MTTIKVRGAIIKEVQIGESDKHLTIFTKDMGKIIVRARGAKNAKSKFITAQSFAYCDFIIYKGANFYSLTQIDLIESFYNIRLNYENLMIAYEITSIIDKYVLIGHIEQAESNETLFLLINSLKELSKNMIDANTVYTIFKLKFLQICGLAPNIENGYIYGLTSPVKVNEEIQSSLKNILSTKTNLVFKCKVSESTQKHLKNVCNLFLKELEI